MNWWKTVITTETYLFFVHRTDRPSNATRLFKTVLNSLLRRLEIVQSIFFDFTPQLQ